MLPSIETAEHLPLFARKKRQALSVLERKVWNLIYIILYLAAIREMYLLFNNIWKHYFLCISHNYFVFQTRRDVVYHISRKNKGKETHTTHTNTRHTYKSTPWKHRSLVLTQNTRPQPGKYPTKQLAVAGQFALFAWLITHGWKYCWLICYERKILFVGWKSTTYKPSEYGGNSFGPCQHLKSQLIQSQQQGASQLIKWCDKMIFPCL